jgi:probable phosphoglycerate mutase
VPDLVSRLACPTGRSIDLRAETDRPGTVVVRSGAMSTAPSPHPKLVLVRHGETDWSASGRHTGSTDIFLSERGREIARSLAARLAGRAFQAVWTSPLARAKETAELAGFGARAESRLELVEWRYGEHEGRTTAEIRVERPGWTVWNGGNPGGETVEEVGTRADRVIAKAGALSNEADASGRAPGDVLVFSHGHFLRILAARWIGLPAKEGGRFTLATGAVCVLGWERETTAIELWNDAART